MTVLGNADVVALAGDLLPYSLAYLTGSHMYGLNTPDSDQDWTVLYYDPEDQRRIFRRHPEVRHSKNNDHKLYSLAKFADLIAKGNPNVVEIAAHLEPDADATGEPALRATARIARETTLQFMACLRPHLVTRHLAAAYVGHLKGIEAEIQSKGLTPKRLSHAVRISDSAFSLLENLQVPDYRTLSPDPEFGVAYRIKTGVIPLDEGQDLFQEGAKQLNEFYREVKDGLPDGQDLKEIINEFFLQH